jgi:hypothetical protein
MKVGEFLDAFPALEDTLIAIAPEFGKLRNPILRRTVAKIATLDQAARIAGLDVRDLVSRLRLAAGQAVAPPSPVTRGSGGLPPDASGAGLDGRPDWLHESRVEATIDADAVLQTGEHPLGLVRRRLAVLPPGRILCIVSGFRPVPLVDALTKEGYACFMGEDGGRIHTYVARR